MGQLGFGPIFQRLWDLYLAYTQAGFRTGYLDVRQLLRNAAGDRIAVRAPALAPGLRQPASRRNLR